MFVEVKRGGKEEVEERSGGGGFNLLNRFALKCLTEEEKTKKEQEDLY